MILRVGNAMLTQWILRAPADLLIENIFPCFSQFVEISFHSAITGDQPSLGIPCYNCLTKQIRKIPLIFMKFFPELLTTFKKLCFRIPLNDNFWNCKTLYRYNSCARYLRIVCLNVLYFTCTNSHNCLNFDFGCFANANFYKLLNHKFFGNTKFCRCKIFSFFSDTKFFWNKLKQHGYVVLGPLI